MRRCARSSFSLPLRTISSASCFSLAAASYSATVASLSVSISALEALQWVKRDVADSTTITVGAGALTLTKEYLEHNTATLGKHPLVVVVYLPETISTLGQNKADKSPRTSNT